MSYRHHILFIILLLIAGCCPNTETPEHTGGMAPPVQEITEVPPAIAEYLSPSEAAMRLDEYFGQKSQYGFSGTVLFAEDGQISFSHAYGFSNLKSRDSLTIESAFQLASVSKPITALAVLKLYQNSLIILDNPVQKYLPEFPYNGISIRMLLNHRSGLPNYMYFADEYWPDRELAVTNRDILEMMVKHQPKPYYPPDKRYNYSNTNYAVLALIVEEVSGMPFEVYVKLNIFLPLDMSNSLIYNKRAYPDNFNRVIGYTGGRRVAENTYLNGVVGDKGVYASALDLFKLDQALYNGTIVCDSILEEAFTLQHKDLHAWDNYGLGWRINAMDPENKIVYHTGWWKGFKTYFIRSLGTRKTLIVLSNTDRSNSLSFKELLTLI